MLPTSTTYSIIEPLNAFLSKLDKLELTDSYFMYTGNSTSWGDQYALYDTCNKKLVASWIDGKIVLNTFAYQEHKQWYKDNPDYKRDNHDLQIDRIWSEVRKQANNQK